MCRCNYVGHFPNLYQTDPTLSLYFKRKKKPSNVAGLSVVYW